MNVLLIMTTGQTDVQLVDGSIRREFGKSRCAALHDELGTRRDDWRVVAPPLRKAEDGVLELPVSPFELCTPKLDAVLRYLGEHSVPPTHALVLETRRDASSARGDPRLAGAVVEKRLRDRGRDVVVWRATFLEGHDRLEDRSEPRDAVIRRDVVARIDGAIRKAIQEGVPKRIVVCATGGFPVVATLVDEAARLHKPAQAKVEFLEIADGATNAPPTHDQAVPRRSIPEPAESYRARRHALELIDNGNFLGAWGAVRHLHADDAEQRWTRIVDWLARFAASLPLPDACDIEVLRHPRMAVRAALRVELALTSGDISRAVHGTVAFFEAALWDHLGSHVTRHPEQRRLFALTPKPADKLVRSVDGTGNDDRKRPFWVEPDRGDEGKTWYRVYDDDVCTIRLAKHYLNKPRLQALGQAVSEVRDLRNDVAHNEPTPDLMNEAQRRMEEAKLWSSSAGFLEQSLISEVLGELDVADPSRLCSGLKAIVRDRLLNAHMVQDPLALHEQDSQGSRDATGSRVS